MTSYYDLVLALIPLALVGGAGALLALGYSFHLAVPAGATASIAIMGHAMFVRAPTDNTSVSRECSSARMSRSSSN